MRLNLGRVAGRVEQRRRVGNFVVVKQAEAVAVWALGESRWRRTHRRGAFPEPVDCVVELFDDDPGSAPRGAMGRPLLGLNDPLTRLPATEG